MRYCNPELDNFYVLEKLSARHYRLFTIRFYVFSVRKSRIIRLLIVRYIVLFLRNLSDLQSIEHGFYERIP
jgi:hypothetical protein